MAMFRLLFAGLPFAAWLGGIEAHRKRGGTAQRTSACHDRANDDVRKNVSRYGGDGVDRATHWSLPWRLRRTVRRKNGTNRRLLSAAKGPLIAIVPRECGPSNACEARLVRETTHPGRCCPS